MDTNDEEKITPIESGDSFKLIKGRNGLSAFLPISQGLGRNKRQLLSIKIV